MTQDPFLNANLLDIPQKFSPERIGSVPGRGVREVTTEDEVSVMVNGEPLGRIAEGNLVIRVRKPFDVNDHSK